MPRLDGYEATQMIRKFCSTHNIDQPTIIAVTGNVSPNQIKKAF